MGHGGAVRTPSGTTHVRDARRLRREGVIIAASCSRRAARAASMAGSAHGLKLRMATFANAGAAAAAATMIAGSKCFTGTNSLFDRLKPRRPYATGSNVRSSVCKAHRKTVTSLSKRRLVRGSLGCCCQPQTGLVAVAPFGLARILGDGSAGCWQVMAESCPRYHTHFLIGSRQLAPLLLPISAALRKLNLKTLKQQVKRPLIQLPRSMRVRVGQR
jgi:hypothetical protein